MNRGFLVFLSLGCMALADTSATAQPRGRRFGDPQAARYGWLSSLDDGRAEARKTGKPLMVVLRCVP